MRWEPSVSRSVAPGAELQVSVGHPLVDEYLRFLTSRARANTRLAVAFDLEVFFSVMDETPVGVTSADAMAWALSHRRCSTCRVRDAHYAQQQPPAAGVH